MECQCGPASGRVCRRTGTEQNNSTICSNSRHMSAEGRKRISALGGHVSLSVGYTAVSSSRRRINHVHIDLRQFHPPLEGNPRLVEEMAIRSIDAG